MNSTFILRVAVAVILVVHSIPAMFDGGVNNFGSFFLDEVGFAPLGVPLAWAIKLSHVAAAILLIADRHLKWAIIPTIGVLLAGIVLVHAQEGWFVVGGGRNGMEYNFLLICVLLAILFPGGFPKPLDAPRIG